MAKQGGIIIPVFECIFNGHQSVESFSREFDDTLYKILPNLYGVCISDNRDGKKRIVAGFFVKTNYTHDDSEFIDVLAGVVVTSEKLSKFLGSHTSFLPARLNVEGSEPLSELVMLQLMNTQLLKFATGGKA